MLQATEKGMLDDATLACLPDAPFCEECGHVTVRSGDSYKCLNCGGTVSPGLLRLEQVLRSLGHWSWQAMPAELCAAWDQLVAEKSQAGRCARGDFRHKGWLAQEVNKLRQKSYPAHTDRSQWLSQLFLALTECVATCKGERADYLASLQERQRPW